MTLILYTGHIPQKHQLVHINSLGDQFTTQGFLYVGMGVENVQIILNQVGVFVQWLQIVINSLNLGDHFTTIQVNINELVSNIYTTQVLINQIKDPVISSQALVNEINVDVLQTLQILINELKLIDETRTLQLLSNYIGNYPAILETITKNIYLDGRNITSSITQTNIVDDEDSIHNTVELQSSDRNLFFLANPFDLQGASRIEIHIGNRILYFLLEKRNGGERWFTLWGRSISARDDFPFHQEIAYSLSEPKSARSVAEGLTTYNSVNWNCDDWVLPASFEFRGSPIEGIIKIANIIGGNVRSGDDGTIEIRNKFPIRPIDIRTATPTFRFDRNNVIEGLSYQEIKGTGYNKIEILGSDNSSGPSPELYLEETSPIQGENVNVRVFWNNMKPPYPDLTTELTTEGVVVVSSSKTEKRTETVVFNRGIANTERPILEFVNYRWIGKSAGVITSNIYTKELTIDTTGETRGYGVAEVEYKTQYRKYKIKDHDVEKLVFIISHQIGNNIDVIVKSMGISDTLEYEAPTINDPLITDKNIAVIRGRNWLDENKYNKKIFDISTPYRDVLIDGILVFINDGEIGCSGNFYVKRSDIIISGPKIINELEVIQWQV